MTYQLHPEDVTSLYHRASEPIPAMTLNGLAHGFLEEAIREAGDREVTRLAAESHIAEGTMGWNCHLGDAVRPTPSHGGCFRLTSAARDGHGRRAENEKNAGWMGPPPTPAAGPPAKSPGGGPSQGELRSTGRGRR